MKRFTNLFLELDRTNKTNDKVALLKSYFISAPEDDKLWGACFIYRPPSSPKNKNRPDSGVGHRRSQYSYVAFS